MDRRLARAAVVVMLLTAATAVNAHGTSKDCMHDRKAIRRPSRSVQAYSESTRRQSSWQPLRVSFDFSRVDANGMATVQQQYVKSLALKAGGWLNRALKVRPVEGALRFVRPSQGPDCGDMESVPDNYVDGVYNTDVVIFVLSDPVDGSECGQYTLAYASHCQLDQHDRPVFGYIQLCAEQTQPKDDISAQDEDFHTVVHEILHILGFSESLFPFYRDERLHPRTPRCPTTFGGNFDSMPPESSVNGEPFKWFHQDVRREGWCCFSDTLGEPPFPCDGNGKRLISEQVLAQTLATGELDRVGGVRRQLRTPALLALARDHFACREMAGVELEDDGGYGTAGSHWDLRLMMNEFMTGVASGWQPVKSALTLALLQDSGWYAANFEVGEGVDGAVNVGGDDSFPHVRVAVCEREFV